MRMIPDYVQNFPSYAEKKVHQLLEGCSRDGYALHSLNVARHATKKTGEIDFLLISPFGFLALEVKGGDLSRLNGRWYQSNPNTGEERELKESPFDQAKDSAYVIQNELKKKDIRSSFGWGVVTPDCDPLPPSAEWSAETYAGRAVCTNSGTFCRWLEGLEGHWRDRVGGRQHRKLDGKTMDAMVKILRPNFELAIPLGRKLEGMRGKLLKFTEEQFSRLDDIDENDRIICRGGAGTGKTFLAMEVLRREAARGRRALYIARSQPLVEYLRAGIDSPDMEVLSYHELEARGVEEPWDVLVVDEGQDLLGEGFLDVLGSSVKGGLEKGRWRWFMDDLHQAGFHDDVDDGAICLLESTGVTLQRLKVNCRNTKQIVHFAQVVTGADIGEAKLQGEGPGPGSEFLEESKVVSTVIDRVKSWIQEEVPAQEIVVLTCADDHNKELLECLPKHVRLLSVREFKGLEAECVAVVGLHSSKDLKSLENQLYTGLTRSRISVWLAIPIEKKDEWETIIKQNLTRMLDNLEGVERE